MYLGRGEPQHANAMSAQPGVARKVPFNPIQLLMRRSVHLYAQLRRWTVEIEHEGANRMLPAEAQAGLVPSKHAPELPLDRSHASAWSARQRQHPW